MKLMSCVLCAAGAYGQSVSVTAPTANQTLSGFSGFSFAASVSSAPSVLTVCYTVDSYSVPNPAGSCSSSANYSLPWNTFWVLNGPHVAVATAYDGTGAVVATSAGVNFTVANNWPVTSSPAITVSTGTALTSNWSGSVSVGGTGSGGGFGSDNYLWYWFVDGIPITSVSNTNATNSISLDTTRFLNGSHIIALVTYDCNDSSCGSGGHGTTYSDGYEGAATEWSRTVTFLNSATGSQVR